MTRVKVKAFFTIFFIHFPLFYAKLQITVDIPMKIHYYKL